MDPEAVRDLVPDRGEERGREREGEVRRRDGAAGELVAALEHVGIRDLLPADPDLDRDVVIAHEIAELLEEIGLEGGRLSDGGVVDARTLKLAEGALRDRLRGAGPVGGPQLGIAEAAPLAAFGAIPEEKYCSRAARCAAMAASCSAISRWTASCGVATVSKGVVASEGWGSACMASFRARGGRSEGWEATGTVSFKARRRAAPAGREAPRPRCLSEWGGGRKKPGGPHPRAASERDAGLTHHGEHRLLPEPGLVGVRDGGERRRSRLSSERAITSTLLGSARSIRRRAIGPGRPAP